LFDKNGNGNTFTWIDGSPLTVEQDMFKPNESKSNNGPKPDFVLVHSDMSMHSRKGGLLRGYGCQRIKSSELCKMCWCCFKKHCYTGCRI